MKIKNLFLLFNLTIIAFLLVLAHFGFSVLTRIENQESLREQRIKSLLIANELRQSSDELTQYCRTYIETGDTLWEHKYKDVIAIRNGRKARRDGRFIALNDSMAKLGLTEAELSKLAEAEMYSNELVHTEMRAFYALKGIFEDSAGQFTIVAAPDTALAHRILFDEKYYADKQKIITSIDQFIELLDNRTKMYLQNRDRQNYNRLTLIIGLFLVFSLILFVYFFIVRDRIFKKIKESDLFRFKSIQTEEKYRMIAENVSDVIWIYKPDTNQFRYFSPSVKKTTGFSDKELTGKNAEDIFTQSSAQKFKILVQNGQSEFMQSPGNDYVFDFELDQICKDGKIIRIEANARFRMNEQSEIELVGSSRDITERKAKDVEIKKLSEIVEQSPTTIVITDIDGRIEYANAQFTELTGYTLDEVKGKTHRIFKTGHTNPEIYESLWQTITSGNVWYGEFLNKDKSGELFWEKAILAPIFSETGEITNYFAIKENITERKKIEHALEESKNLHRDILNAFDDRIYMNNPDFRIVYCNSAMEASIGRNPIGELCYKAIYNREESCPWCIYPQLSENKKQIEYERVKGNKVFRSNNLLLENGNKLSIFRDISVRKKAAQALSDSEQRLRLAQKAGRIGTWDWDMRSNQLIWSSTTFKIFGFKRNQDTITYSEFLNFVHPDDKKDLLANLNDAIQKGKEKIKSEYRIIKEKETIVYIQASAQIILDERKKPVRMVGVMQDVSKQKRAEQALKDSEERFKSISDSAGEAIILSDKEGRIRFWNTAAYRIFYYTQDEIVGRKIHEILNEHPFDEGQTMNFPELNFSGKAVPISRTVEMTAKRKTGEEFPIEMTLSEFFLNGEEHFVSIVRDITGRKKTEQKILKQKQEYQALNEEYAEQNKMLIQAKYEAEAASRLKSDFLANMSHEIRTPMNAILGFSSILQKKLLKEAHKDYIEKIVVSGNNLLELINDILDLSKIEAGQLSIEKKPSNPTQIFNEIPFIFSQISQKKRVPVNVLFPENLPETLVIDAVKIRQILLNLVGNALKFTDRGAVTLQVMSRPTRSRLTLSLTNIDLIFSVQDTGIGIDSDQLDLIFESFKQADSSGNRKYGGTGLGLAITKRLVELMNGTITVKSKPGKGSLFTVVLNDIEVLKHKPVSVDKSENAQWKKSNFDTVKILHVEDDFYNRELIRLYFGEVVGEIKEAESGMKALEILESYRPDLILMDIQMPELNGYETAHLIRQNPKLVDIPIVAISANATKEEIERYADVFNEYLTKPVEEEKLVRVLSKYIRGAGSAKIDTKPREKSKQKEILPELRQAKEPLPDDFRASYIETMSQDYINLRENMTVKNLKDFLSKFTNLTNLYKVEKYKTITDQLTKYVEHFDIVKIRSGIAEFALVDAEIRQLIKP